MKIKKHSNDNFCSSGPVSENTASRVVRKGAQSNYDEFVIPPGMSEWENAPLYMIIARWCLLQKRWVNRDDIEAAFHLDTRRASFQLSYISRKKSRVVCQARYYSKEEGGRQRIELRVDDILPESPADTGKTPPCPGTKKKPGGRVPTSRLGSGMTGNGCAWETLLKRVREGHRDE
ncbi:CaiF/GrlA family transcriptional regulator [Salmonella enterica subsp. salamae]|uniref:CaiF/GrlA family transcriptional regulator n=1 Tax=Salmonella enterica TaxID=28901 RepID=UPI001E5D3EB0|nr:CaiF/GrlA family transcriptional regulator [Salmonella enterica]